MNYALITPVKDEIDNLRGLANTIFCQEERPKIWVIVDGNSQDGTYFEAKKLFKDHDWIHVIKQNHFFESGYSHKNFAEAVNQGLKYAVTIAEEQKVKIDFIGKTDATVLLDSNYFVELKNELLLHENLAIICGPQHQVNVAGSIDRREPIGDILSDFNDIRLYRREFLEQVGGYPLTYSPDMVLLIYALNRGWKVKVCQATFNYDTRSGGTKIGVWKGYILKGRSMMALGYSTSLLVMNGLYYSIGKPHYRGIAILFGAFLCFISKERLIDVEVNSYLGEQRFKEVITSYLK